MSSYNAGMHGYHHGDLRHALIDATESLLAENGPQSFSLREVARRAGVSPAAPAHHFGDSSGLLTAVAVLAFDELAAALRAGEARGGRDARRRLIEQGVAYVEFAMRFPGRLRLMFGEALRGDDAELARAGNAAFLVLENGVRACFGIPEGKPLPPKAWTALLALWSVVHGYAHLAIAGRFDPFCGEDARRGEFVAATLRPVLRGAIAGSVPAISSPAGGAPRGRRAPSRKRASP
jgi:AcrR family transcriptional regulator